jgi:hypothetical protein
MRIQMLVATWLAVATLGGCDDGGGAGVTIRPDAAPDAALPDAAPPLPVDSSRKLCDGSDGLRLAYGVGGAFRPPAPADLFFEPGSSFLYVDGHCHFWVESVDKYEGATHEGVLDAEVELRLTAVTHFQSWPSMVGPYTCSEPPPADAGGGHFEDGTLRPSCPPCPSDAPEELLYACENILTMRRQLWAAGAPMDGPVRLYVEAAGGAAPADEADWPLARGLDEVAAATAAQPLVITDAADAAALRALREASQAAHVDDGAIAVRSPGGQHYLLHVRDVLPFEDAVTGRVEF